MWWCIQPTLIHTFTNYNYCLGYTQLCVCVKSNAVIWIQTCKIDRKRAGPKLIISGLPKMCRGCSLKPVIYFVLATARSNEGVEVRIRNVFVTGGRFSSSLCCFKCMNRLVGVFFQGVSKMCLCCPCVLGPNRKFTHLLILCICRTIQWQPSEMLVCLWLCLGSLMFEPSHQHHMYVNLWHISCAVEYHIHCKKYLKHVKWTILVTGVGP